MSFLRQEKTQMKKRIKKRVTKKMPFFFLLLCGKQKTTKPKQKKR